MFQHPDHPRCYRDQTKQGLHKDWRAWSVVILMLLAMAAYVLTGDEALGSGGQPQEAVESGE